MKFKLFTFLIILSFKIYATQNKNFQNASGAEIKFDELTHSFGKLNKGEKCEFKFRFTNVGNEPLIISNSQTSCGCTVTTWPKEPIMPGQSNEISYKYDTQRIGAFVKTASVCSNAKNSTEFLKICGMVIDKAISNENKFYSDEYCKCISQGSVKRVMPRIKSDSISSQERTVINIFPNPFETQATVQFDKNLNDANLMMYNMIGEQVKEIKNISGSSYSIQRDNLPSGIYFISLMQNSMLVTTKRIVIAD